MIRPTPIPTEEASTGDELNARYILSTGPLSGEMFEIRAVVESKHAGNLVLRRPSNGHGDDEPERLLLFDGHAYRFDDLSHIGSNAQIAPTA